VRQALIISVDRQALADNIWRGLSEPVSQPGIPGSPGYDQSLPLVYDPAKANSLLDAAGYPRGADGTRFAVDFLYWFKGPGEDTVFAVQDMWRDIGVQMDAEFMEVGQWLRYYRRQDGKDQRQIMGILLQDYFANNAAYLDRQSPNKTGANVWYQNDKFYELREQVFSEFVPERRADLMEQALREMSEWEDPAFWYSLTVPSMWAVQPYIKGFRPESGTQFTLSNMYRTQ
jgi:ABC-type transport system substrate-binding protein